jgi:hypothetical protein
VVVVAEAAVVVVAAAAAVEVVEVVEVAAALVAAALAGAVLVVAASLADRRLHSEVLWIRASRYRNPRPRSAPRVRTLRQEALPVGCSPHINACPRRRFRISDRRADDLATDPVCIAAAHVSVGGSRTLLRAAAIREVCASFGCVTPHRRCNSYDSREQRPAAHRVLFHAAMSHVQPDNEFSMRVANSSFVTPLPPNSGASITVGRPQEASILATTPFRFAGPRHCTSRGDQHEY